MMAESELTPKWLYNNQICINFGAAAGGLGS